MSVGPARGPAPAGAGRPVRAGVTADPEHRAPFNQSTVRHEGNRAPWPAHGRPVDAGMVRHPVGADPRAWQPPGEAA